MSNHAIGETEITVAGGTTYRFKVGMAALIECQEQIGRETGTVPTFDAMLADIQKNRLLAVRAFLWAGLRKYHAEVTLDGVCDVVDRSNAQEVAALLLGLRASTQPDGRDLAALEDAGARPTGAAGPTPRPVNATATTRGPGRARSISRRARRA